MDRMGQSEYKIIIITITKADHVYEYERPLLNRILLQISYYLLSIDYVNSLPCSASFA
jgi:hypothetical protein